MKQDTLDRDAAFAEVCRRLIAGYRKNRRSIVFSELVKEAMNTRPDHHYVSYESALRMLYILRRGRPKDFVRPDSAAKWHELNAQVDTVMARRPKLTFPRAVAFTLVYKRPSRFYIPEIRAKVILRRVLAEELMVVTRA